jgi:hypothetical protein
MAGRPDWVFWGIVVPWLVCAIVSAWFALCVMQDAPLASDADVPPDDSPADANSPVGRPLPDSNAPGSNAPGSPAAGGRP